MKRETESDRRRDDIFNILLDSVDPLTGSYLSSIFGVSRQVIVQDIAILRAAGSEIIATPQGYIVPKHPIIKRHHQVLACQHLLDGMEEELMTIVDLGGKILDVTVEHPVYGEFKGQLMINSPSDVRVFVNKMKKHGAEPLSSLTEGIHIHTIEADNPEILHKIEEALKKKGFLIE